jgi:citrate synthase
MSSRKRSTMKATVAPCAGGSGAARSFRPASARCRPPFFLTAAFDTKGASDIVLQSFYTHSPHAKGEGIGREGDAMLIGKPGAARTAIAAASSDRVIVRGRDLANDLMGRVSFTDYVFLLAAGRAPTEEQRFFLDLSLVALAEHGLTPSVQAARMTYDADPAALQGAIAAGVLGCGTVILGAADLCRKVIEDVLARVDACGSLEVAALDVASEHRNERKPLPGYGHPLHKPVDPRAERMIALARERGIAGRSVEAALALTKAAAQTWGKPLPMNVSMSIAATLRDVDVPLGLIRAAPILARTAGLIAHCIEEEETQIGFLMASKGEEAILHVADAGGGA